MIKKALLVALLGTLVLGCSIPSGPKGYAIVFGVSLYDLDLSGNRGNNLQFTDDDAVAMSALLKSQGWEVSLFLNGNATKIALEATLKELANADAPVLFYFSGHGTADDNGENAYIVPYDGFHSVPVYSLNYDKMVSPSELIKLFSDNNIANGIVLLDCCNSGAFVNPDGFASGVPDDYQPNTEGGNMSSAAGLVRPAISAFASFSKSSGVLFMAAAGSRELSYESSSFGNHGVFTYYLLESATEGDSDGDGFVSTVEAFGYVTKKINENWNAESSDPYIPRYSGLARDYLLFKVVE